MTSQRDGKDRFSNDVLWQSIVVGSSSDEALFHLKYKCNKGLGSSRKLLLISMHDTPLASDKKLITDTFCSRKYPNILPGAAS